MSFGEFAPADANRTTHVTPQIRKAMEEATTLLSASFQIRSLDWEHATLEADLSENALEWLLSQNFVRDIDLGSLPTRPEPIDTLLDPSIREQLFQWELLGVPTPPEWRMLRLSLPAKRDFSLSPLSEQEIRNALFRTEKAFSRMSPELRDRILAHPETWDQVERFRIHFNPKENWYRGYLESEHLSLWVQGAKEHGLDSSKVRILRVPVPDGQLLVEATPRFLVFAAAHMVVKKVERASPKRAP